MTPSQSILAELLIPHAILAGAIIITLWRHHMPDFTALTAATTELTATVARVETLIASQNDVAVQASIDAATQAVSDANTGLTNLAPVTTPTA